jgi:hypothetical protein
VGSREDFTVGQKVMVRSYRFAKPGEIVKVGRTLVTIAYGYATQQFRMDDQCLNEKNFGYQTQFRTEAQEEADERRTTALAVLKVHGLRPGMPGRTAVPLAKLEAVAAVLEASWPQEAPDA